MTDTAPRQPPIDLRRIGLAVFAALAVILAVDAVRSMIQPRICCPPKRTRMRVPAWAPSERSWGTP